ncbi:MAG: DUF6448 family protein, partial [Planctomycetota bacterium]
MRTRMILIGMVAALLLTVSPVWAHCDRLNGPVVQSAREALNSGEFAEVQIWVGEKQEDELKQAFDQALRVRKMGGEAKELADRYFFETTVRLHRAAEGMPYT